MIHLADVAGVIFLVQHLAAQTPRELEQQLQRHHEQTQAEFRKADEERRAAVEGIRVVQREIGDGVQAIPEVVKEMRLLREAMTEAQAAQTAMVQTILDITFKAFGTLGLVIVALVRGVPFAKALLNGRKNRE